MDFQTLKPVVARAVEAPSALEPPAFALGVIECEGNELVSTEAIESCLAKEAAKLGGTHYVLLGRDSQVSTGYVPGYATSTYVPNPTPIQPYAPVTTPSFSQGTWQTTYTPGFATTSVTRTVIAAVYRWTTTPPGHRPEQPSSPHLQRAFSCACRCVGGALPLLWGACWKTCQINPDRGAPTAVTTAEPAPAPIGPNLQQCVASCQALTHADASSCSNLCSSIHARYEMPNVAR